MRPSATTCPSSWSSDTTTLEFFDCHGAVKSPPHGVESHGSPALGIRPDVAICAVPHWDSNQTVRILRTAAFPARPVPVHLRHSRQARPAARSRRWATEEIAGLGAMRDCFDEVTGGDVYVRLSTVGVAQPIVINFPGLVDDSGAAESAVHISSVPPVPGKFYWMTPTQLRWRPPNFWPAHTAVPVGDGVAW
jgi:hypothetical protein